MWLNHSMNALSNATLCPSDNPFDDPRALAEVRTHPRPGGSAVQVRARVRVLGGLEGYLPARDLVFRDGDVVIETTTHGKSATAVFVLTAPPSRSAVVAVRARSAEPGFAVPVVAGSGTCP